MKESKPLLFIQSVKTETKGKYQTIYDSRDITQTRVHPSRTVDKEIDPTILRKIELLINRANDGQPILCNVITKHDQYKGLVTKSDEEHIYVKDEQEEIYEVALDSIREIRIIRIDY
ncbi:hypothetical protein [Haloplasma contractile]|uniref:Spore coat CotO protein n=1 Tax=Haloplasma contractile SSD-17B TaxID=1033810 RepID=U2DSS4_9MOLU|nr:hypothetical protein [Haloplasma contractile]ERJ11542.1 Spore coat CotO protein [Haloplasma contractile SSD-17B]